MNHIEKHEYYDPKKATSFTTATTSPLNEKIVIVAGTGLVNKYHKGFSAISRDGGKTFEHSPLKGNPNRPTITRKED